MGKKYGYGGMIKEDRSAVANMPQGVKQMAYPPRDYTGYALNDDISGVDMELKNNIGKVNSRRPDSKY